MSQGQLSVRALLIGALLVLPTTGTGASERSRVLPFDLRAGTNIVVPVRVDGHGPYRFLLDTGSSRTVVSTRLADALGLVPIAETLLLTPAGRAGHPIAVVRRIELGAAPPTNVLAMIVPESDLPGSVRVDGIVGQDVLSALTYTIDYVNHQIEWHVAAPQNLPGQRLALHRSERGVLVTLPQPSIGDLHFVPDSGADGWVFFAQSEQRLPVAKSLGVALLRTLSGERSVLCILIDELSVGGLTLRDQLAVIIQSERRDAALGDGLLPLHLFARVTFSPREQVLVVEGK